MKYILLLLSLIFSGCNSQNKCCSCECKTCDKDCKNCDCCK